MHSIIIFASGTGTNAAAIINHFKQTKQAAVTLIVSNKADAGVIGIAEREHIPFLIVDKKRFSERLFQDQLESYRPSLIVLAGFLWKIPDNIVSIFRDKIINIHPSLLPDHGGKGMYGNFVHEAVLAAGKTESGITIHYVNEVYDEGNIIIQARCPVQSGDSPTSLANRIHQLEHFFYPRAIEFILNSI